VKNASEGEAGTRIGGRRHQRLLPQPPGRYGQALQLTA